MPRFQKYTTSYNGTSVTYYVAMDKKDEAEAARLNEENGVDIANYARVCEAGEAKDVSTTVELTDG